MNMEYTLLFGVEFNLIMASRPNVSNCKGTQVPLLEYCNSEGEVVADNNENNWLVVKLDSSTTSTYLIETSVQSLNPFTYVYRRVVSFFKGTQTEPVIESRLHQDFDSSPVAAARSPQRRESSYQVRSTDDETQTAEVSPRSPQRITECHPPSHFTVAGYDLVTNGWRYNLIEHPDEDKKNNPLMTIEDTKFRHESFYSKNAVRMSCELKHDWIGEPVIGLYHGNTIRVSGFSLAIACQYPVIHQKFLAAQPKISTVGKPENIERFLQMIMQYETELVVNLTSERDDETKYFPDAKLGNSQGNNIYFGRFWTEKLSEDKGISKILITSVNDKQELLSHKPVDYIHFDCWGDFGDANLREFVSLIDKVRNYSRVVIHCRAGVGRTMTLLA